VNRASKKTARPTNTIVAPDAVSRMIDPTRPSTTLRSAKIGDRMTVCRSDLLICTLVTAGRTSKAEIRSTPTMGMDTMIAIPARTPTQIGTDQLFVKGFYCATLNGIA
jgi:hypothetical protein